jgi:adenosylcobinamide-GDP ribazoletransferase
MRALVAAITFLTRVPIPGRWDFGASDVGKGARWFPLVGTLIGLAYAVAVWILSPFLPALVIGVIVVGLEAGLTGALHLDGLADAADGFGGGHTRDDVLRIMRDHAIGSYGGVALVLLISLKVTAIAGLIDQHRLGPYLILSPMLGRWSAVLLSCLLPYARRTSPEGSEFGGAVSDFVSWRELTVASLFSMLVAVPVGGWRGMICWVSVIALSGASAMVCRRRIGGVTGDTLGANTEMCEAIVLLAGLAMR